MNKSNMCGLILIMLFNFANVTFANNDNRNYIGLDFGWSKGSKFRNSNGAYMNDSQAHSGQLGGNVGRYVTDNLRIDISAAKIFNLQYKQTLGNSIFNNAYDIYYTKIKMHNAMLSAYYDIDMGSDFIRPFFGIGMGYSKIKSRYNISTGLGVGSLINLPYSRSFSKSNFTYKAAFGLTLRLSDVARMDVAYNYINYGKVNFINIKSRTPSLLPVGDLKVHSILFGPKISF